MMPGQMMVRRAMCLVTGPTRTKPIGPPKPFVPVPHPFDNQHHTSAATVKMWHNLTFYMALPAVVLVGISVYIHETTHHEERPKFIAYDHLRLRKKKFPWGDGNHSLFHNPHVNPLPDGYEDE